MTIKLQKSIFKGIVNCPPSKSYAIRLMAGASMAKGVSYLYNTGRSDDVLNASEILKLHFAEVEDGSKYLKIFDHFAESNNQHLFCGESGLNARLFPLLKLLLSNEFNIEACGTLLNRPVAKDLLQLKQLGVQTTENNDMYLPLRISGGKLNSGKYTIEGARSSQFVTGLLMAMPLLKGDSEITVENISSLNYIFLTIEVLQLFGINIQYVSPNKFKIKGNQQYIPGKYIVEGDWSSAAFLFVAGALLGEIKIQGLNPNSIQADRDILEIFRLAKLKWSYKEGIYHIEKSKIKSFEYDFLHCPDLFPVAMLLACHADGVSKFTGISKLQLKESNRLKVLCEEFGKSGVETICMREEVIIKACSNPCFASYDSHKDHRVAMALTLHAMTSEQGGEIDDIACISKSYPNFVKDIKTLGGNVYE